MGDCGDEFRSGGGHEVQGDIDSDFCDGFKSDVHSGAEGEESRQGWIDAAGDDSGNDGRDLSDRNSNESGRELPADVAGHKPSALCQPDGQGPGVLCLT